MEQLKEQIKAIPDDYEFEVNVHWDRIGRCKLEKGDRTMVFCRCGCRPYCPCHQQLEDERDGLCGRGRHPFWDIPDKVFVEWYGKQGGEGLLHALKENDRIEDQLGMCDVCGKPAVSVRGSSSGFSRKCGAHTYP